MGVLKKQVSKNRVDFAYLTILFLFLCSLPSFGQHSGKTILITRTETPPKIDGLLQDKCWGSIQPVSGFFQHDPKNGEQASEETQVWVVYDQKYIYFAFLMKDSQPNKIWAELTPRNGYDNNDSITVILDAYNDKRTSISFTLNPKGVQKNSIETIWKSAALVRSDGWAAEMAIPFKSLRFSTKADQIWGINFERYIHRLNEQDYWTDVGRDAPLLHQMGELRGLSGIRPGYNLEFFPYAGFRSSRWGEEKDDKFAAGLDFKYGILPNLILDLTASPDFSEVESDPFIYRLSPYENYFSENRPFFSEGSQYFRLATQREHSWRPDFNLFYSRRISNPKFAAKISGKTGRYSFGILGALNDEVDMDSLYSVVRIQRDILKNSQIGFYYAGMDNSDEYNRNFAVDYSFNFKDIYYIRGMSALSFYNGENHRNNGIHLLQFERDADAGFQLSFDFQRIESDVELRTGFLNKIDSQSTEVSMGHAWRFNQGAVKRFSLDMSGTLHQDTHGNTTGYSGYLSYWTEFLAQFMIHGGFSLGKTKYQIFDDKNNLVWTEDYFQTFGGDFLDFRWMRGGFLKEASVELGWEKRGIYNEDFSEVEPGSEVRAGLEMSLRPLSYFEWSVSGSWIKQTIDQTKEKVFDGVTYATSLHFQISRSLFLSTRLLGETREDQYNLDFLVGYYFGAGNIIQLSYKKSARKVGFEREKGYSITLKISYLLRI